MKKLLLLTALFPLLSFAQTDSSKMIPEGTIVTVKLLEDLSSKTSHVGDIVEFETTEPIIINKYVLVETGAKCSGKVTEVEKPKGMGKGGKLTFSIDYLGLPTGKNIKLTSEQKGEGKKKQGAAVAEAVLLTPLFLFKKGKNMKFEKGQIFKVFVDKDSYL